LRQIVLMRAMVLQSQRQPLQLVDVPKPKPAAGQVLVRVHACAICRTDLHVIDGELPRPKPPLIPGHEVVGVVAEKGEGAHRFLIGDRVGVPWLGWTCGECAFCRSNRENLCDYARFTGYTIDGGYAEFIVADERFCFPIPGAYSDAGAAPLLCAGMIGYRSLVKAGDGKRLGLYGFGAAARLIAQVAIFQGRRVFAFTRPGNVPSQEFARALGATWAGNSGTMPPEPLDAALIFAPVGELVPLALKALDKGGIVVCAGIHMSDVPSFPYDLLWQERRICSVANLTRHDGDEFLALASRMPLSANVGKFPLEAANEALSRLRHGKIHGAAVLVTS